MVGWLQRWEQHLRVWRCRGVLWTLPAWRQLSSSCQGTRQQSLRAQTPSGASSGAWALDPPRQILQSSTQSLLSRKVNGCLPYHYFATISKDNVDWVCERPCGTAGFPEWSEVMDDWGTKMLAAVSTVAEVVACGLGLPADAFTSRMQMGPHLLAPTGKAVHWNSVRGNALRAMVLQDIMLQMGSDTTE